MDQVTREEGTYLYCIVDHGSRETFGDIGLEDSPVYTIPYGEIGAVVSRCCAEPYKTEDEEKAKEWILTHQYVIDLSTDRFGTVIPLTFDTIFKGGDARVEAWLTENYDRLRDLQRRLRGKAEYGVRVYVDESNLIRMIEDNPEISRLIKAIENKPEGAAYLLKKRYDQVVKIQREIAARSFAEKLRKKIEGFVYDIRLEGVKNDPHEKSRLMVLNASCLVKDECVKPLGDLLGEIARENGFTVKFTGPWPPYSFVSNDAKESQSGPR